jgi:hypothetical protein
MALGVQTDMATPLLARFGTVDQKEQYLRPALEGAMVASIAVSEPDAGSGEPLLAKQHIQFTLAELDLLRVYNRSIAEAHQAGQILARMDGYTAWSPG